MARFEELSAREPTSAGRWRRELVGLLNDRRLDDYRGRIADDFTDDSRQTAFGLLLDRAEFVAGTEVFIEQGLKVRILEVVATAGDRCVLTRRQLVGDDTASTPLLQIDVFDVDGNLTRMVDFDEDRLDDALAELARVSGVPVSERSSTDLSALLDGMSSAFRNEFR